MLTGKERVRDKRRVGRARVSIPARYASSELSLEGYVTDLSSDGVFFASDYLDAEGEHAVLSIDLPFRGEPLELRGEVRWVKDGPLGCGMGIRFVDVSHDDLALLRRLSGDDDLTPTGEHFETTIPTGHA